MSGDRLVAADVAARSVRPSPTANRVGLSGTSVEKTRDVGAGVGAWVSGRLPAWRVFGSRSMGGRRRRSPGSGDVAGVAARDRVGVDGGAGMITAEYFDVGCSRRVAWERRPQAAGLLKRVCDRISRSMRWWCASSSGRSPTASSSRSQDCWRGGGSRCGCRRPVGRCGSEDPTHPVLMRVLAAQSQREVVRSRHRTVAAMRVQAVEQGRFLGGRPPYGYRLVDAGPHPNQFGSRG